MPTTKSTPPLVRFAHPMAFSAFLRHMGAPMEPFFYRHGLPTLCENSDAFVPLLRVWTFFDDAARREDPMLGWLVGAHVGDHGLNASLLRKLETVPTLLRALQELGRLVRLEASDRTIGIHVRRDDVLFYTHCIGLTQAPGYTIAQAYALSIFIDLVRHFIGPDWLPLEIGLEATHVSPILEERFPGSRIVAQQKTSYITVPRSCLHRSSPFGNAQLEETDATLISKNSNYVDTLRVLLQSYLPEGYPSERFAAELMNTTVRTLTRRLSEYGFTYGTLIDDLRFQVAKDHMQRVDARLLDVAHAVGFSDQANFTRMFRRVGGLTPREYRRQLEVSS